MGGLVQHVSVFESLLATKINFGESCEECVVNDDEASKRWKLTNTTSRDKVLRTLTFWSTGKSWNVREVEESRRCLIRIRGGHDVDTLTNAELADGVRQHRRFCSDYSDTVLEKRYFAKFQFEFLRFEKSGCARNLKGDATSKQPKHKHINATLMRPHSDDWHVFYNQSQSLYAACLIQLQDILKLYARSRRNKISRYVCQTNAL